jgi:hypothetical protein
MSADIPSPPVEQAGELEAKERERQYRAELVEDLEQSKRAVAERQQAAAASVAQQRLDLDRDRLAEQRAERQRKVDVQEWREKARIEDAAAKKAKEKARAFSDLIKLPKEQHEAKLSELAKRLDEDVASLSESFAEYAATETSSSTESEWDDIEPWPEPVTTAAILEELIARINIHIKAKPHLVLAVTLWEMMAWVHEEAAHYSVYLVATSPKEDCGKTTLIIEVVGRLAQRAHACSSGPSLSSIFRTADRDKAMQLFDNVDTMFERKPEITELFTCGWTRGVKVPRVERIGGEWQTVWYDPFTPKACSMIGTNLPRPLLGRCLLIELWPLKPGETVVEVNPFDQELMEAFKTLRRKLLRWSNDNAATLKNAKPVFPDGFTTRPRANAKLLLAIAELAGDDWAELARNALDKLLREKREPSWLDRLLEEFWTVFITQGRENIRSEHLATRLLADPESMWCEYARGKDRGHRVTVRELAAIMNPLHIYPRPIGKSRLRGYHRADFLDKEIFQHFLGRDPLIRSPQPKKDATPNKKARRRKKKK